MATSTDPNSGFSPKTTTFHSLRPPLPLPPASLPSFALSLLPSPLPSRPVLIDATSSSSLSFPSFLSQLHNLSYNLQTHLNISKADVAFILSPTRLDLPLLYFSLLSLGLCISPANPSSTPHEISRLFNLVNPTIAFATSSTVSKLPSHVTTILLDSPTFSSFLHTKSLVNQTNYIDIKQTATAVIQFSSGTTGAVKAAALSHGNLIATVALVRANRALGKTHVTLVTAPLFHSMGFAAVVAGVVMGDTTVVMDRPGFSEMLGAVERCRVTALVAAPPVVVAMGRKEEVLGFDVGELEEVVCGGAPLAAGDAVRFRERFPGVLLRQVS